MALIPVADGEIATVVTTLRMSERPRLRPTPESRLRLVRWSAPTPARYRVLFRRIGEPWLWYSRLALDEAALVAIISDARVEVNAVVDPAGIEIGMVELDLRTPGCCEIAYFGLVPDLTGRGHGRWLMAETLARAWRPGIEAVGVNTCTLDSPRALGFYRAQGFAVVRRTLETFPDPRIAGLLPREAAPQIPYLATSRR
ncbi:GNAT family N-acetyltransferase [Sphingomonas oligophenolica]|uniref:GNAT family N-acetyltransferase n=1 Tax=Sphingomonas oligophenolica TaxID=301154 RepID=A0A502CQ95_9SPHN|nr:GNAT family N-acetyltransferase [Sphingomonas oligophenolica]TPG15397.1 GNAT family N-acetyltransferase [Sphingomonas oligophenolica]